MQELTPLQRFLASATAQGGGIILLLMIGILPFSNTQLNIALGVMWIIYAMAATTCGLLIGIALAAYRARKLGKLDHRCVDRAITIYLVFDIVIVLFLVCQEGGLCRSIFIPLFFLIPIALMIVEPHDKMSRVYVVLSVLVVCIIISYAVSRYVGTPNDSKIDALPLGGGRLLPVTYFSELAHPGYDVSVFIVSLLSVIIPILQKLVIGTINLFVGDQAQASAGDNEAR
jgi:lysylphosphatidylglycerol synthetase-like protein (DUF2156 family)